jgi:PPOX class probable F420-dependent enzyme
MDAPNESPAPPALPERIRAFLSAPRYATIATVQPDGSAHQAVVWYGVDGDAILINSRRGRRWPANLERDPRISLAVFDDARPEHWVAVRGTVEVVRTGAAAVPDIQALARRYDGDPDAYLGQDRITFRISVNATFEYGDE